MSGFDLLKAGLQIWLDTKIKSSNEYGGTEVTQVASSAIDEVTYDVATQTLGVTFRSGSHYTYLNVPEQIYEDLVQAGSVGQEFNFEVKGSYFFVRG